VALTHLADSRALRGIRRLLILTERDPLDTRPQAFSPFKRLELPPPVCQDQLRVTTPKPSNSGLRSSPRIACYGTAFLSDFPVDTAALKRGIAPDVPQFSSPRLDASFLMNCARLLTGTDPTEDNRSPNSKRVGGTDFPLKKATHFYECSAELCDLLATLTEQRAAEMATDWYGKHRPTDPQVSEANGRTQRRLAMLNNLASLARQVKPSHTILMLRVEYRKQR
jgi:hypothetical protein